MIIHLYNNNSDKRVLDKVLLNDLEIQGRVRDVISLTKPSLLISLDNTTLELVMESNNNLVLDDDLNLVKYQIKNQILESNYLYIDDFKRYYYIDNITSIRQDLFQIDCVEDEKMSFKEDILNLSLMINRNQYDYDINLKDDNVICENNLNVTYQEINSLFKYGIDELNYNSIEMSVIINYNNNFKTLSDIDNVNWITGTSMLNQRDISTIRTNWNCMTLIPQYTLYDLANSVNNASNECISFINGIFVLPFKINVPTDYVKENESIIFNYRMDEQSILHPVDGYELSVNYKCDQLPNQLFKGFPVSHKFRIDRMYNDYRDFAPYTKYELYCPFVGWINLEPELILDKDLIWSMRVDELSMNAFISLDCDNKSLFTTQVDCIQKLSVNQIKQVANEDRRIANNISLITGVASSIASIGASVATGNSAFAIMGSGSGLVNTISQYALNSRTNRISADNGLTQGKSNKFDNKDCLVKITRQIIDNTRYDHVTSLLGRPLFQIRNLSDIHGYTEIDEKSIINVKNATLKELNNIKDELVNGIILP